MKSSAIAPVVFALSVAWADAALAQVPECYDVLASARVVRQTPTPSPGCGDDCVVMSWPWIVDLDVRSVVRGTAKRGLATVLTLQHTDFREGLVDVWWLRRNTLGSFNVVAVGSDEEVARCAANSPPARPYLQPRPGKSLADVRRDSELVKP